MRITVKFLAAGNIKDIEIAVPLNHLTNFCKGLGMSLINCGINLTLCWSASCVSTNSTDAGTFALTDTKFYVPVLTLNKDKAKLLQELKSGFKRTINWYQYQPKVTAQAQNQYLDYLIDPSFQRDYLL